MKKLTTSLFILLSIAFATQAQTKCGSPVNNLLFQQLYRTVQSQTQAQGKLTEAKNVAANNCLTTAQVKQIAGTFENDYDRLEFCKAAYVNTFDKDNFYDVYDVFAYYSTVFRLHDFVNGIVRKSRPVPPPTETKPTPPPAPEDPFKNITFPDYRMYTGNKGCNMPIAENDFDYHLKNVKATIGENNKFNSTMAVVNSNCLSAAQLMKLALVMELETSRLNLLKAAYAHCYDQGNYNKMIQVFKHQPNQDELMAFYNEQNKPKGDEQPVPPPCSVSDADMAAIKNTISKQYVESSKVTTIKQIIRSKKCFTVNQIKDIIRLMSIESYKMDMAKFAYEFCIDKENYFQVADVLNIASYKRELSEFLEGKQ